jgi:flagellar motor protein MotB
MKILTLFTFSLFFIFTTLSQKRNNKEIDQLIENGTESELVFKSTSLLEDKMFVDAEKVIDKLLTFQSESPNYNYRKGYVVIKLGQNYEAAIPYLTIGVTKVSKFYDVYSAKELNAPVDALYYLGRSYHYMGKTSEAKSFYSEFIEKTDKKSDLIKYANLGLEQCEVAERQLRSPNEGVKVKNAGNKVNSKYPEYSPVVSLDGTGLFYTICKPWDNKNSSEYINPKTGLYLEDIYTSLLDDKNNWKDPVKMEFSKIDQNEATSAISIEERYIYSYTDETGAGDIYYSDFKNNKFEKPRIFDAKNVNSPYWESHLTISPSGNFMYFVSDRPGGFGGRDIYECKKLADGTWSEPVNMGKKINTPFDEESPFISVNEKYFYFASNGPKSMGGFDLMYATKNNEDVWGEAENIGYPLNSFGDDIYYTSTTDGFKGYFTSNRPGGEGEKDIYEVENNYLGIESIAFLKVKVNTVDNLPLPDNYRIALTCLDCDDKKERMIYSRPRDGMMMSILEPCKTYRLVYQIGENHQVVFEDTIKTDCESVYQEKTSEHLLDVVKKKKVDVEEVEEVQVVAIKEAEAIFYYRYNKNKLFVGNREFRRFLRKIEKQLENNSENIIIKISSSASTVPTDKYENNQDLSRSRAENMKYDIINYLEKNSSYKNRISIVIYESLVDGPEYDGDGKNRGKYEPFQFTKIKTEN